MNLHPRIIAMEMFKKHRKFTRIFFDDIILFSKNEAEHRKHLAIVFEELKQHQLFVNAKKSEFFLAQIRYLGHIVSKDGVRMDPTKIQAIQEWRELKLVHEVRSFLGLCAYYRRFVKHFAFLAAPLHELAKKKAIFKWTQEEKDAFQNLKSALILGEVLIIPDLYKPFAVECDGCGDCIGAVLNQEGHAIAYESRRLQHAELHLQVYEEELLAVIHALTIWKHYLQGADFMVRTDHQSLRYFLTQSKLSEKHMRWVNFLSMFHFQILHTPRKKNVVADALSRRPQVHAITIAYHEVADALSRRPQVHAITIAYHEDLSVMRNTYHLDEDFAHVWADLQEGIAVPSYVIKDGYLMMQNRMCVVKNLRHKVMDECHAPPYAGHRGILATTQALERYFFWPYIHRDIESYVRECRVCQKVKFDRHKAPGLLWVQSLASHQLTIHTQMDKVK